MYQETRSSTPSTAIGNDSIGPSPPPSPHNNNTNNAATTSVNDEPSYGMRRGLGPAPSSGSTGRRKDAMPPPTDTTTTTTTTSSAGGRAVAANNKVVYTRNESLDESFADVASRCRALLAFAPSTPELRKRHEQVESQKLLNEELEMRIRQLKGEMLSFDSVGTRPFNNQGRLDVSGTASVVTGGKRVTHPNGTLQPPAPPPKSIIHQDGIGLPISTNLNNTTRGQTIILPNAASLAVRGVSSASHTPNGNTTSTPGKRAAGVNIPPAPSTTRDDEGLRSSRLPRTQEGNAGAAGGGLILSPFKQHPLAALDERNQNQKLSGLNDDIHIAAMGMAAEQRMSSKHVQLPPPPPTPSSVQSYSAVPTSLYPQRQPEMASAAPTRTVSPPRPGSRGYYNRIHVADVGLSNNGSPSELPSVINVLASRAQQPPPPPPPEAANKYLAAARSQLWENERYNATAEIRDRSLSERLERAGSSRSASVEDNTNKGPTLGNFSAADEGVAAPQRYTAAVIESAVRRPPVPHPMLSPDTTGFDYHYPFVSVAPSAAAPFRAAAPPVANDDGLQSFSEGSKSPTAKPPNSTSATSTLDGPSRRAAPLGAAGGNENLRGLYADPEPMWASSEGGQNAQLPTMATIGSLDDYVKAAVLTQVQLLAELAAADEAKREQERAAAEVRARTAGGLMLVATGKNMPPPQHDNHLVLLPVGGQLSSTVNPLHNSVSTPTSVILDSNPLDRVSRFHQNQHATTASTGISLLRFGKEQNNLGFLSPSKRIGNVGGVGGLGSPLTTPSRSQRAAEALHILRQQQQEKRDLTVCNNNGVWDHTERKASPQASGVLDISGLSIGNSSTATAAFETTTSARGAPHEHSLNKSPQRRRREGSLYECQVGDGVEVGGQQIHQAPEGDEDILTAVTATTADPVASSELTTPTPSMFQLKRPATQQQAQLARSGASVTSEEEGPATIEILGGSMDRGAIGSTDELPTRGGGEATIIIGGQKDGGNTKRTTTGGFSDDAANASPAGSASSPIILLSAVLSEEPSAFSETLKPSTSSRPLSPDPSMRSVISPLRGTTNEGLTFTSGDNPKPSSQQGADGGLRATRMTSPKRSNIRDVNSAQGSPLLNPNSSTTLDNINQNRRNIITSPSSADVGELVTQPPNRKYISPFLEDEQQAAKAREIISPANIPTPPTSIPSSKAPSNRPPLAPDGGPGKLPSRPPPSPSNRGSSLPPTPTNNSIPPALTVDAATMTNNTVPPLASLSSIEDIEGVSTPPANGSTPPKGPSTEVVEETGAWPDGRINKGGAPQGVPVIRRVSLVSGMVTKGAEEVDGAGGAIVSINGRRGSQTSNMLNTKGGAPIHHRSGAAQYGSYTATGNPTVVTQQEFRHMLQSAWGTGGHEGGQGDANSSGINTSRGDTSGHLLSTPEQRGYYTARDFAKDPRYFSSGTGHVTRGSSPQRGRSKSPQKKEKKSSTGANNNEQPSGVNNTTSKDGKVSVASAVAAALCCKPAEDILYEDSEENAIVIKNEKLLSAVAEDERLHPFQRRSGTLQQQQRTTVNNATGAVSAGYVTPRQSLVMLAAGIAAPILSVPQYPAAPSAVSPDTTAAAEATNQQSPNKSSVMSESRNRAVSGGSITMLSSATLSTTRPPTPSGASSAVAAPASSVASPAGRLGQSQLRSPETTFTSGGTGTIGTGAGDHQRGAEAVDVNSRRSTALTSSSAAAKSDARGGPQVEPSKAIGGGATGRPPASLASSTPQSPLIPKHSANANPTATLSSDTLRPSSQRRNVMNGSSTYGDTNAASSTTVDLSATNNRNERNDVDSQRANALLQRSLSKASSSATVNHPAQSEDRSVNSYNRGAAVVGVGGPPSVSASDRFRSPISATNITTKSAIAAARENKARQNVAGGSASKDGGEGSAGTQQALAAGSGQRRTSPQKGSITSTAAAAAVAAPTTHLAMLRMKASELAASEDEGEGSQRRGPTSRQPRGTTSRRLSVTDVVKNTNTSNNKENLQSAATKQSPASILLSPSSSKAAAGGGGGAAVSPASSSLVFNSNANNGGGGNLNDSRRSSVVSFADNSLPPKGPS